MSEQTDIQTVADIPDTNDWELFTGSHEKNHVLEHVGINPENYSHGSIFVKVGNGDYETVFFFGGNVPWLSKSVTRIY